jgi:hypothetical protein
MEIFRIHLTRFAMRTPIRFKAMGLAADQSERHFPEALTFPKVDLFHVGPPAGWHAHRGYFAHAIGDYR